MAPSRTKRRRLFFTVAVAGLVAVACNGIVGLDEYSRAVCTDYDCGVNPDVNQPDVVTDAATDANRVDGGQGAAPVSWARWKMPNYVFTVDAGTPNPLSNPPNVQPGATDEVNDLVSGLVWRKAALPNNLSLADAQRACADIPPTGSWRLPKRIELVTLLDYGHGKPLIDTTKFSVASVRVWTSSEVRPFAGGTDQRYWTVSFDNGKVEPQRASDVAVALCIKNK